LPFDVNHGHSAQDRLDDFLLPFGNAAERDTRKGEAELTVGMINPVLTRLTESKKFELDREEGRRLTKWANGI
jgi:hypothetical protein